MGLAWAGLVAANMYIFGAVGLCYMCGLFGFSFRRQDGSVLLGREWSGCWVPASDFRDADVPFDLVSDLSPEMTFVSDEKQIHKKKDRRQ